MKAFLGFVIALSSASICWGVKRIRLVSEAAPSTRSIDWVFTAQKSGHFEACEAASCLWITREQTEDDFGTFGIVLLVGLSDIAR